MKRVVKQDENICGDCKYYCQHYRKEGDNFHAIGCGHCRYPRVKQRVRDQSCKYWTERTKT